VEGDAVQIVNVMKVKEGNLSRYGQLLEDTTREACSAGKFDGIFVFVPEKKNQFQ
jgi:hypothetical protein